jgi:hypothetical protein
MFGQHARHEAQTFPSPVALLASLRPCYPASGCSIIGFTVVLAHELGHAVYAGKRGGDPINPSLKGKVVNGLNVKLNENPVRAALGVKPREHYRGYIIPWYLK